MDNNLFEKKLMNFIEFVNLNIEKRESSKKRYDKIKNQIKNFKEIFCDETKMQNKKEIIDNIKELIKENIEKYDVLYKNKSFDLFRQINNSSKKITIIPGIDMSHIDDFLLNDNDVKTNFWNLLYELHENIQQSSSITLNNNPFIGIQGVNEQNYNIQSFSKNYTNEAEAKDDSAKESNTLLSNIINNVGINNEIINSISTNLSNMSTDDIELAKKNVKSICGCPEDNKMIDNIVDNLANEIKKVDLTKDNLYENLIKIATNVSQNNDINNEDATKMYQSAEKYMQNMLNNLGGSNSILSSLFKNLKQ